MTQTTSQLVSKADAIDALNAGLAAEREHHRTRNLNITTPDAFFAAHDTVLTARGYAYMPGSGCTCVDRGDGNEAHEYTCGWRKLAQ